MSPSTKPQPDDAIGNLLACELVVICGPGGVGKTTTAAALGAYAAQHTDKRVLVITVDPARRLATALGLAAFGNEARRVDEEAWAEVGVAPRGELSIAMLDTKASWDRLIENHSPDPETRDAILANELYQNLTSFRAIKIDFNNFQWFACFESYCRTCFHRCCSVSRLSKVEAL